MRNHLLLVVSLLLCSCADTGNSAELETRTFAMDAGADVPPNTVPDAVDDAFEVDEDGSAELDVLANDTDADGDPLTVFVSDPPQDGVLEPMGNGTFRYTPRANFNGVDSFVYGVLDGHGGSAEATVSLTILPTNDAPGFVPPTPSNGALLDVVAANELSVPLTTSDIDGDTVTLSIAPLGTSTEPALVPEGLLWTPGISDIGRHTLSVTASDGELEATREFSVNVTGQADTPCGTTICTQGQSCFFGLCVDPCVTDVDCTGGDRCFDGRCAANACENRPCADDENCVLGGCFRACEFDGECFAGERCYDGRCAEGSCADIVCATDEVCAGGNCRSACATDGDCSSGTCFDGGCAATACENVLCPSGQACEEGACVADPASGPMTTEESGGCATASASTSLWALVLAVFVWARRR